ncbi:transmembrane emp24 domain-containing protein p24beta3-like [Hibiscus syriacus]|uniref:transmembrane emp24 domain-containing protein p24beta3-like n=1 Tax=Hibiscus syriacus TaxID=106335 RepID=UPI001922EA17|nr:transmembrane emp24 domain-containing protein p24beta3-like [Hibiscus syriacus]
MERECGKMWALIGLLLLNSVTDVSSLSITVDKLECVYEPVNSEGDNISGNFAVVDHQIFWSADHPGIDFYVTAPGGMIVHTEKGTAGNKFEVKAPLRGMYKFCFHNPHGSTPETVSFYLHIGHIPNEHDLAKDEHLHPINVKIAELRESLQSITAEQIYLRARDDQHRHTNESTRKRVIGYTVGEYILLSLVSVLQVVYIRRLFNKSIGYNRV